MLRLGAMMLVPATVKFQVVDVGTCAGELEQRVDATEVMVDGVCILEGQSQHAFSVSHSTGKCHQVGTKYKAGTYLEDITTLYKSD